MTQSNKILVRAFGDTHDIRCQVPFDAGGDEPEPDFVLVPLSAGLDSSRAHPDVADLIIELADTSLTYDRDVKSHLYARAGVPEYWIINLVDRRLEVHRDPEPRAGTLLGHAYRTMLTFDAGQSCTPLFAPDCALSVDALMG